MKPFNIELAKQGNPVCTRDGRMARIICFDRKFYHDGYNYLIVAMVNDNDNELIHAYTQDGLLVGNKKGDLDLMMLPEKKEEWLNVYHGLKKSEYVCSDIVFNTKEKAIQYTQNEEDYITTVKISWEE